MQRCDPSAQAGPGEIQKTPKTGAVALALNRSGADEHSQRIALTDADDAVGNMSQ